MVAIALEAEDGVDHVLEGTGTGQGAVLGDVAHQHHADPVLLGRADQAGGTFPDLGDRAGR